MCLTVRETNRKREGGKRDRKRWRESTCLFPGTSMKSDSRTSFHSASSTKEKSHSDSPIPTTYGLPPPLIAEQLISLSGDRKLLIHSHLLEFSGSLSVLASLPQAIEWTLSELVSFVPLFFIGHVALSFRVLHVQE